ncbi:hypothetical protein [Dokdonella fugitiva]|jgi:hypothetical protein|uniref:hypothetical protein n=1 Tax=Dokdonella fugitiva TaxID=328517 RepID=UPI0010514955|nr:hypothetical protein [Dokdonella fugitiva]
MRPQLLRWLFAASSIFGSSSALAGVAIPSDVSVDVQASQSSNLHPGDRITFTVSATNHGPEVISEWAFRSSPIYDELDIGSISTDCFGQFFVSVVDLENSFYYEFDWYPPHQPVQPGQSLICHVSIDYTAYAPPSYQFGYFLSSYLTDLDPSNNASFVELTRAAAPPLAVSAISNRGLVALFALIVIAAWRRSRVQ